MITLTINVPAISQVLAAGFDHIQVLKSSNQTAAGPYTAQTPTIPLAANTTSYSFVDAAGGYGDWYETEYLASGTPSTPSAPQPGYLSDLLATVRDLLGVTTVEVSDSQIQGFAFLPTALSRVRGRLASTYGVSAVTFDGVVAAGGDGQAAALGALAHLTAALLCPRMTVMVVDSEQFDKYKYQRNRQMDWSQTQQQLLAQYELLISKAAGETQAVGAPTGVTPLVVAGPTSSGKTPSGALTPANASDDPFENPLVPYSQSILH